MVLTVRPPSARAAASRRFSLRTLVRTEGPQTVVVLRGEADFSTTSVLSDALSRVIALCAGDVVIDFAELEFMDTATCRILVGARQLLDRQGRTLIVRSPSALASRVLHFFGLADLIDVAERA